MNKLKKYSFIFLITGILVVIYSFIVIVFFENKDLGVRSGLSSFYVSDVFLTLGVIWIIFGLIYFIFFKFDKIQLNNILIIKHYWLSFFFVMLLVSFPILDKFFPTSEYNGSLLNAFFMLYALVSIVLLVVSVFLFFKNILISTYTYYVIS